MMSRLYKYIFCTLSILLILTTGGCIKNEFSVTFTLSPNINTNTRIAYYGADSHGGIFIESAVVISAGKGEMKGITKLPCVVYIYEGQSVLPACVFLAERGDDIKITGEDASPLTWSVDGNKANRLITQWRMENRQTIGDAVSSRGEYDAAPLNKAVAAFVKAHPDSPASIVILSSYYDAKESPSEYDALVKTLNDSGVLDDYPTLMGRHDIAMMPQEGEIGVGKAVNDLIVRSYRTGADTLRLKTSNKSGLLYFWRREDENRKRDIDSLKRIVKWRGDSTRFTIADIALEPDSAVWAFSLRADSLNSVVRGWMPRCDADPDVMRLGITTTPWWIVTSPGGKIVYSGPDAAKALERIRR